MSHPEIRFNGTASSSPLIPSSPARLHRPLVLLYHPNRLFQDTIAEAADPDWLEVRRVADQSVLLQTLQKGFAQAIVLSTSTAERSGLDLLKRIRSNPEIEATPILVLAEGADYERIVSLELGADDCLLAPFLSREVWLRVRSLLRRSIYLGKPAIIDTPELYFDPDSRQVCILGKPVHLTETEFQLLALLLKKPDSVVEKRDLTKALPRSSGPVLDYRTINTHMRRLRSKLGPVGEKLKNIRSVGYKLAWKPTPSPS